MTTNIMRDNISQSNVKEIYADKLIIFEVKIFDIFNCVGTAHIFDRANEDDFYRKYDILLEEGKEAFIFFGNNVGIVNNKYIDISKGYINDENSE